MLRVLSLALVTLLASVQPDGGRAQEPPRFDAAKLAERDARVSFTRGAATRARAFLDPDSVESRGSFGSLDGDPVDLLQLDDSVEARGAALIALGGGGGRREVPLLESFAVSGRPTERRAALFGLAEMGGVGLAALTRLAGDVVSDFEDTLVFAVDHAGRRDPKCAREARALLERLVAKPSGSSGRAFADAARRALDANPDRPGGATRDTLELFWSLRWRAGRDYGFVDGRRWREAQFEALLGNEEFLDRFVLRAAELLEPSAIQVHVMDMVGARDGARAPRVGVLRGIVATNAGALDELFSSGNWSPGTKRNWDAILDELELSRTSADTPALLEAAVKADPRLFERAGVLLLRGGHEPPAGWLDRARSRGSEAVWVALYESAGDRGDPRFVPKVQTMISSGAHPELDPVGTIALARLGHERSVDRLEDLLARGPSEERALAIRGLARVAYDTNVRSMLTGLARVDDLSELERTRIRLAFASVREWPDRAAVHQWLLAGAEPRTERARTVRALAESARSADLEVFRHLFPVEDDLDLNLELALALFTKRDKEMLEILRRALWSEEVNRGVIAGGVLVSTAGMRSLMEELDNPPRRATDAALRRVGFAIGEWGGVPAVEELALRRSERDPGLQGAVLGALAARGSER